MKCMPLAGLVGMGLLLSTVSCADPAPHVQTGEAAECHRLLTLCEALRHHAQAIQAREAEAEWKNHKADKKEQEADKVLTQWEKTARNRHAAPAKAVLRTDKYQQVTGEETRTAQGQGQTETLQNQKVDKYEEELQATDDEAARIRATHATMPACFQECADVLNLEEFQ